MPASVVVSGRHNVGLDVGRDDGGSGQHAAGRVRHCAVELRAGHLRVRQGAA